MRIDDIWIDSYISTTQRDGDFVSITVKFSRIRTHDDRAHVGDIRQMHGAYWKAVSTSRTLRGLLKGESSVNWELCNFPPAKESKDA